jgi:hypothetical protein
MTLPRQRIEIMPRRGHVHRAPIGEGFRILSSILAGRATFALGRDG